MAQQPIPPTPLRLTQQLALEAQSFCMHSIEARTRIQNVELALARCTETALCSVETTSLWPRAAATPHRLLCNY
jgi:hypothetical protein